MINVRLATRTVADQLKDLQLDMIVLDVLKNVLQRLSRRDAGVFQLESAGHARYHLTTKPAKSLEDLIALVERTLPTRPAPGRHGGRLYKAKKGSARS